VSGRLERDVAEASRDPGTLVPLPPQPAEVPWPTTVWPLGDAPDHPALQRLVDGMMDDGDRYGTTYAVVVVQGGRLRLERYGGCLEHWDREDEPVTAGTPLLSWSMAKSILHAAVGILVGDGRLRLDDPVPIPPWQQPDDPRRLITLDDLLTMRDGLDFVEDYIDDGVSHVIEMLFGTGKDDVAGYAVARPPAHPPGEVFNYSSGTSNIIARLVGDAIGGGPEGMEAFLRSELFAPIGMTSARPRFDDAGTFIGSTFVYATARDFARFGLLYLRDGRWEDRRILPVGWVDHARRPRSVDATNGWGYGAHWWVTGDARGAFWANGYAGQSLLVVPALDLVVVRLGNSTAEQYPALAAWRAEIADVVAEALAR
jgi:CubicO group peptidase (beta-lactamase class C family)